MHQPVLTVVMVPVSPLIIRADNPFRDEVGFLRQSAVTVIPVKIVRVTGDTVIRPHAEGAVRVQLRVGRRLPAGSVAYGISMPRLHIIIRAINLIYLFIMRLLNTNH